MATGHGPKAPRYCYWRGSTLWARIKVGGREYRETLRTSDPREAARRVKTYRARLQREKIAGPAPEIRAGHTWQEATEKWQAEVLPGAVKPTVAKRYAVSLRQLEATFGGLTVEAITARSIAEYVSSRAGKATNATIKRDITALSRLLAACCAWGWREDNPARAYDRSLIRERRDPTQPPSPEDVAKLIASAPPGMAAILRLLNETGMRENEAVTLERSQVDPKRRQIVLTRTKTNRPRVISWKTPGGDASGALAAGEPEGFLFLTERGDRYRSFAASARDTMRRLIASEAEAGRRFRRFRVHDLRHGFAIRALKAGMSIYQLSRHLGHSSVKTTETYLGYLSWEEQEAVKAAGPNTASAAQAA